MEYVEAIDKLLGMVGRRVMVVIGDGKEARPWVASFIGILRQGEPSGFFAMFGEGVVERASFWQIGDADYSGVWILQDRFRSAEWRDDPGILTIRTGEVETLFMETPGGQPDGA